MNNEHLQAIIFKEAQKPVQPFELDGMIFPLWHTYTEQEKAFYIKCNDHARKLARHVAETINTIAAVINTDPTTPASHYPAQCILENLIALLQAKV